MPLKRGPNNTFRFYSSATGRYEKNPLQYLEIIQKKKLTKKERDILVFQSFCNRAKQVGDPLLLETYKIIYQSYPRTVKHIGEKVFIPKEKRSREFDIICKNAIVEVKSSTHPQHVAQLLAQKDYADDVGLKHIIYAPNIASKPKKTYLEFGLIVATSSQELIKELENI